MLASISYYDDVPSECKHAMQEQSRAVQITNPLFPLRILLTTSLTPRFKHLASEAANKIEIIINKHGEIIIKATANGGIAIFQTSADELEGSLAELLAGERLRDGRQGHRRPLCLGLRVATHCRTAVSSSSAAAAVDL